ncbi:MAG: DUF1249 domain-containing protein [Candidatus Thiodiazotropha sp. L084R]
MKRLLSLRPTMGSVLDLSEENYSLLLRMAPDIKSQVGEYRSRLGDSMDLYLDVIEQTPYTTLVHLTYYFTHVVGDYPDPDAMLRVYHDSKQIDVIDIRQSTLPLQRWGANPTLEQRWKINLFLSKWLRYCAEQGHTFQIENRDMRNEFPMSKVG